MADDDSEGFRFNFGLGVEGDDKEGEEEKDDSDKQPPSKTHGSASEGKMSRGEKFNVKASRVFPEDSSTDKLKKNDGDEVPLSSSSPPSTSEYSIANIGDGITVKTVIFDQAKLAKSSNLNKIISKSDLQPTVYEGGFKLWECSIDLARHLRSHPYVFKEKSVLDLGCGHGVPGITAIRGGAKLVGFQDLNIEVLKHVTIPNVLENVQEITFGKLQTVGAAVRFFSGDWRDNELANLLTAPTTRDSISERTRTNGGRWDLVLTSDTLYSLESIPWLVALIQKILADDGICLVAAKRYYFGIGGGVADLIKEVERTGVLEAKVVQIIDDGKSNLREIVRIARRSSIREEYEGGNNNDCNAHKKDDADDDEQKNEAESTPSAVKRKRDQ
eukprot:jgi/Bigna1/67735/fgenesh1_pg.4_\